LEFAGFFSDFGQGIIHFFPLSVAPGVYSFPGLLQRGALRYAFFFFSFTIAFNTIMRLFFLMSRDK
jgi:hypothetical protein